MKRLLILGAAFIGVLLIAVAAVPFLVPSSVYREKIAETASSALGRPVSLDGDVKLSIFPRIEAVAGKASIANPEGFGDAPFAQISELRAAVRLLPLFSRRVEIAEFVLVDPSITLIQTPDGNNNWTFVTGNEPPADPSGAPGSTAGLEASLGDVRLVNGRISFEDRKAGTQQLVEKLNITARMDALTDPLQLKGDGAYNGLDFKLDATLGTLASVIEGKATEVAATVDTGLANTDVKGTVTLGETPTVSLDFDASSPDVVKLADWFEVTDLPVAGALKAVSAKGHAEGPLDNLVVTIASLTHTSGLLNATATGKVNVGKTLTFDTQLQADVSDIAALASMAKVEAPAASSLGKATIKAKVGGTLEDIRATAIDFTQTSNQLQTSFKGAARVAGDITYDGDVSIASNDLRALAASAGAELPAGDVYRKFSLAGAAKGTLDKVTLSGATLSFDDLKGTGDMALVLSGALPRLTGTLALSALDVTPYVVASGGAKSETQSKPSGWPTEALDLEPLKTLEADLKVSASSLRYQKFDVGQSRLDVTIRDGKLTANLSETALYGGLGTAQIIADASSGTPRIGLTANLDGLNIKPFLAAAANFGWVDGNGGLKLTLAGEGASMDAIMRSLTGSGSFNLDQGQVGGVNIPRIMSLAKTAMASGNIADVLTADQETGFTNLGATFSLLNGVASTKDLSMILPQITVPGQGQLDIGKQTLSLNLAPKSGDKTLGINGFAPPIRVSGAWGSLLKPSLDFDAIKGAAVAAVTDLAREELAKKLTEQGLPVSVDQNGALKPGVAGSEEVAVDLLRNVFGGKKATPTPTPSPTTTPSPTASETPAPASTSTPTPVVTPSPSPTPAPVTVETPSTEATPATPAVEPSPTPTPSASPTPKSLEDAARDELKKALGGILQ